MADVFLILVCIVLPVLILLGNVYVLINFQHPEDHNQAYFPKAVVVFSLTLSVVSVLMFPLDVANTRACDEDISCNLTLPMKDLWYAVYVTMAINVAFIIPFCIFFYEADYELTLRGKVWSAASYNLATLVVLTLSLGLGYGLAGFADFEAQRLESGLMPIGDARLHGISNCIGVDGAIDVVNGLCDAGLSSAKEDWEVRVSFPVYVIALSSVVGWVLFMVFAGVGVVALPVDYIRGFFGRPRAIITKTEFLTRASAIAVRARKLKTKVDALRRNEKAKGRLNRQNKRQSRVVNKEVEELEDDERKLREVYPQGDNADFLWALAVLGYYVKFVVGCVCVVVSIIWLLHIVLYVFVQPPASPMLNDLFIELDNFFPLFGVSFFGLFCFYLIAITIKGNFTLGLNILFITIHPMKQNGTLMSSFLFNAGLISLCSIAVIQFCAQAFSLYASETAIRDIFDVQINNLRGIKYLYKDNVFLIMFFIFTGLSFVYLLCAPNKEKRKWKNALEEEL